MTRGGCRALDESRCVSGRIESRIGLPGREDCHSTGDPTSGVGSWSEPALPHYLSTGHAEGRVTASGPMGEALDLRLVHLTAKTFPRWSLICALFRRSPIRTRRRLNRRTRSPGIPRG